MPRLQRFSDTQVLAMREFHKKERARRIRGRPADFFPWHPIQRWVLDAPADVDGDVRIILAAGGNRGGKSGVSKGTLSKMLRRDSPLCDQLVTMDDYTGEVRPKNERDPLNIWVVPPTMEKARSDWVAPQDGYGLRYWIGNHYLDHKKSPDLVYFARPPGKEEKECYDARGRVREEAVDKILIKSQDQALETFESSEVDLVIFDEEVLREDVWNSCRMRIGTTHGIIMMAYTPLHGLSWSYKRYWKPLVKDGEAQRVGDRRWVHEPVGPGANILCAQMGAADNPKAAVYAEEIEVDAGMGKAEKAARLYGEYGYVEGALIPKLAGLDLSKPLPEHEPYVVSVLPGQKVRNVRVPGKLKNFFLVSDPNKSYGATLAAKDEDGNLFFIAEHLKEAWPDRKHAQAFKRMERKWAHPGRVHRYADPGSAGAQSIVNMADLGVSFDTMPKGAGSVSASVKKLRGLTFCDPTHRHPITKKPGAPRVYFYRPGLLEGGKTESKLVAQVSEARQTDNESAPPDTPHKDIRSKLDLFDCARYTAIVVDGVPTGKSSPERGRGRVDDQHIPSDASLDKKKPDEPGPFDMNFDIPDYDFGGKQWSPSY